MGRVQGYVSHIVGLSKAAMGHGVKIPARNLRRSKQGVDIGIVNNHVGIL